MFSNRNGDRLRSSMAMDRIRHNAMIFRTLEQCDNPACREKISRLEGLVRKYEAVIYGQPDSVHPPSRHTTPLSIVQSSPIGPSGPQQAPVPQASGELSWTFKVATKNSFVHCNPSRPQQARAPQGSGDTKAATITNFIARVPASEAKWEEKRTVIGLNTSQGILKAFDDILLSRHIAKIEPLCSSLPSSKLPPSSQISSHLEHRALEVGEACSKALRAVACSLFGSLVFLGECCVALELGVSSKEVDKSMTEFLTIARSSKCTAGSDTLRQYRRVPIWVAEQMHKLHEVYYHRAFELFLHGMSRCTLAGFDP